MFVGEDDELCRGIDTESLVTCVVMSVVCCAVVVAVSFAVLVFAVGCAVIV